MSIPPPRPTTADNIHNNPNEKLQRRMLLVSISLLLAGAATAGVILYLEDQKTPVVNKPASNPGSPVSTNLSPDQPDSSLHVRRSSRQSLKKDLLNNGLRDWEIWLGPPHYSVDLPDSPAVEPGSRRPALGAQDPTDVFTLTEIEGEPALRISGEISGGIMTRKRFSNYHFSAQFKFNNKRWPAALNQEIHDSGILVHTFGKNGMAHESWRYSLEYQIRNWTAGQLWLLGSKVQVPVRFNKLASANPRYVFDLESPLTEVSTRVSRNSDRLFKKDDWNTADIYMQGGELIFLLNGEVTVMAIDAKKAAYREEEPLTEGQIYLQSAGSEILFRRITIEEQSGFPAELEQRMKRLREQ